LHIVKSVVLCSIAIVNEALFLSCYALQNALLKQGSADSDKVTPICGSAKRELKASRLQRGFRSPLHHPFAKQLKGDLWVSAFQHGAGQAEQYIAPFVVRGNPSRIVAEVGRAFEQSRSFTIHVQRPARFPGEPVSQPFGLAPYCRKVLVSRGHQGAHQQGTQASTEFILLLRLLEIPNALAIFSWRSTNVHIDSWVREIVSR
jgi:hypothetical protein